MDVRDLAPIGVCQRPHEIVVYVYLRHVLRIAGASGGTRVFPIPPDDVFNDPFNRIR